MAKAGRYGGAARERDGAQSAESSCMAKAGKENGEKHSFYTNKNRYARLYNSRNNYGDIKHLH